MKKRVIILVLLIMLILVMVSYMNAQELTGPLTATTGNDYMQFKEYEKYMYVRGMMDVCYALLHYYDSEFYQKYEEKLQYMTIIQINRIFDRYLEENPDEWHQSAAVCFLWALEEIIFE